MSLPQFFWQRLLAHFCSGAPNYVFVAKFCAIEVLKNGIILTLFDTYIAQNHQNNPLPDTDYTISDQYKPIL